MSAPEPRLAQVQRWMQTVIMHPGGVAEGVDSPEAREHLDVTLAELEQVIARSQALSSENRLEIYVNAYHARLLECLDEEFAVARYALGDELFGAVAFGYLQRFPSQSYTLGQLGATFPRYLAESRLHAVETPDGATSSWADFVIELATFERTMYEVYDGPGTENGETLRQEQLAQIPPTDWDELRLVVAPCLRLCEFDHPVHEYWAARKDGGEPDACVARKTWLAVYRREYVVEHRELSSLEFILLAEITRGSSLSQALVQALNSAAADGAAIESQLGDWFARWSGDGYFTGFEIAGQSG